jgi:aspartate/methionine/tyrosine aminotransferase
MYPGYQSLYEIAKSMQCNVSKWYPKKDNSFDINDLIQQITPKTKLIVINFPHNPTGAVITQKELERVIAVAAENDIRIFSDEMYRHLEYSPDIRLPSVSDVYHQGISLFGMSKTFGLPGLRIGWITAKDKKLFQEMCQFKDYTTICSSAPSEMLALIALKNKERIIARNLEIIKNNLLILEEFFEKYKKLFRWRRPLAGPIAFPEVLTDQPIQAFCQDLVKKKGIMLLPAAVYDYPGQNVRFGYGRKNIPEILTILEDYIQEEKL